MLNRQPLLAPRPLALDVLDELALRDAPDVLERSGFGVADDPHTGRLVLTAVPFSRGTLFGPDDVAEMAQALRAGARPDEVRPSRCASCCCAERGSCGGGDAPRPFSRGTLFGPDDMAQMAQALRAGARLEQV